MCYTKQCCAQVNGRRCENETIRPTADHCATHYTKAVKLYKNYKRICAKAYELDIEKTCETIEEQIKYLQS